MTIRAGFRLAFLAVCALTLSACSGTIPVNYSAQNFVRYKGAVDIGPFDYAPTRISEREGRPVAANQLQNTAVGSIYIAVNVADLVQRATALELERTGVAIGQDSPLVLSGDVLEFKAADLGYSVDWTYSVRYVLKRRSDNESVLSEVYAADPKKTGKFGMAADYAPSVNEMILSAYDKFIRDPKVRALVESK